MNRRENLKDRTITMFARFRLLQIFFAHNIIFRCRLNEHSIAIKTSMKIVMIAFYVLFMAALIRAIDDNISQYLP